MAQFKSSIFSSSIFMNLIAIFAGIIIGQVFGKSVSDLGIVAWLPVAIIKGLASPLLFLAILSGLTNDQMNGAGVGRMFTVCGINAMAAVVIAASLVNTFEPGLALKDLVLGVLHSESITNSTAIKSTTALAVKTMTWTDAIKGLVPESVAAPFVQNNIPAILILAVLFGVAARRAGKEGDHWASWFLNLRIGLDHGLNILSQMMGVVWKFMPLAIMASVAKATGEHGLVVFKGLVWYVLVCIGGMFIQIIFVYQAWIVVRAKRTLREFWEHARLPVIYAFGVNSSLASLPTTLTALDRLKVSAGASRLGACVGTNFNNDGILLYEVAALLMLGQAAGFDWSLGHQLALAGVCVLATLGVSGFPEAGVIALSLVLASAGLPVELLPLLLPVDWLVARMRSATNVISDMTVSLAIDSARP